MAKVISICSQKGGVGKTTTAIEIATCLKRMKKRVLVIDFDQQGDLTRSVNGQESKLNSFTVINADCLVEDAIQKLEFFDLVSSSKDLSKVEKTFTERDDIYVLDEQLKAVKTNYDYILIDNNPDLGQLLTMSIVASDLVVIPTECDINSINGLRETEGLIQKLKGGRHAETQAKVIGYILTKYEGNTNMDKLAVSMLNDMSTSSEDKPFVMYVSKSKMISEAKTFNEPICYSHKGSKQSREYWEIVEEIVKRAEEV